MAPWDGSQNYDYPPGTEGVPDTTIESNSYNTFIRDLRDHDLNIARPIHRGGTAGTTAVEALTNLGGEKAQQVVTNYDATTWLSGSFYSAAGATNAPVAGHRFVGFVAVQDSNNIVLDAFDLDSSPAGERYQRVKKDGAWVNSGAWATGYVKKSGDVMTGPLTLAPASGSPVLNLNAPTINDQSVIFANKANKTRWAIIPGAATGESSGNVGSDFLILRYDDAGAYLGPALQIARATGTQSIYGNVNLNANDGNGGFVVTAPAGQICASYFRSKTGQPTYLICGIPDLTTELQTDAAGNFLLNHTGLASAAFASNRVGAVANTLVLNGGNVGIGTSNPLGKLHISASDFSVIFQRPAYTNYAVLNFTTTAAGTFWAIGVRASDVVPSNSFSLYSTVLGANAITFLDTGNVGIGTMSPGSYTDPARRTLSVIDQTSRAFIEVGSLATGGLIGQLAFVAPNAVSNLGAGAGGYQMCAILALAQGGSPGTAGGQLNFYARPPGGGGFVAEIVTMTQTNVNITASTISNSPTNGALTIAGGVGIGGALVMGGTIYPTATGSGMATGAGSLGSIEVRGAGGGSAAFISFHRPGVYATYFGLDSDNFIKIGGWSVGAAAYRVVHEGLANVVLPGWVTINSFLQVNNGTPTGGTIYFGNNSSAYITYDGSNILFSNKVGSYNGYFMKQGISGALIGNSFNFYWNGSNEECWVDGSYIGSIAMMSDYRTKKDVVDLPSTWSAIKSLRPIKYTQKDYTPKGAENPLVLADDIERWGFMAHELQDTLTPYAATGKKDEDNVLQSPNTMVVLAAVTRALQEAMFRIEKLEGSIH